MSELAARIAATQAWVERQGIVLQSAKGPVPNLADHVAGEAIRGSWWGHRSGRDIYAVLEAVEASGTVASTRLVGGKITLVHRRLWPALVALADRFDRRRLAWTVSEHTPSGAHRNRVVDFPEWIPLDLRAAGRDLDSGAALAALPECLR